MVTTRSSPRDIFAAEKRGDITTQQAASLLTEQKTAIDAAKASAPAAATPTAPSGPGVPASPTPKATTPPKPVPSGTKTVAEQAKRRQDDAFAQVETALKSGASVSASVLKAAGVAPQEIQRITSQQKAFAQVQAALKSGASVTASALRAAGVSKQNITKITGEQKNRAELAKIPGVKVDGGFDLEAAFAAKAPIEVIRGAGFDPGEVARAQDAATAFAQAKTAVAAGIPVSRAVLERADVSPADITRILAEQVPAAKAVKIAPEGVRALDRLRVKRDILDILKAKNPAEAIRFQRGDTLNLTAALLADVPKALLLSANLFTAAQVEAGSVGRGRMGARPVTTRASAPTGL
ncbi:hypothetical protein LCGC14_1979100, partial [marine sediment metagenome]